MSDNMDPMAEIRASFFIECEELMEALQDGLQAMDDGEGDEETINVVFRAVHSIKGGAGAFGLEELVRFAHRYETALDEVRAGRLTADDAAHKLFFAAADHLSDLIRVSRDEGDFPTDRSAELLKQLDVIIGEEADDAAPEAEIEFQPTGLALDLNLDDLGDTPIEPPSFKEATLESLDGHTYKITFVPSPEMFETGNEAMHLLRNLSDLGKCECSIVFEGLPDISQLDAERPYIQWEIQITTAADTDELQSVFEFVEGLCKLEIKRVKTFGEGETNQAPDLILPISGEIDSIDTAVPEDTVAIEKFVEKPEIATKDQQTSKQQSKAPPAKKNGAGKQSPSQTKSVVRVDLDRIERLVNLVGELVINQAMLSQSLEQSGLSTHSDAMNGLEEFQRLTRDIQDSVMMIRAQPVKSLFQRMSRIVREASNAVHKEVRLITEGENTEVDKTVIERLADPLTHMIRNAVDHGLELPEDRESNGKTRQGIVRLRAFHKSGRVVIEVADDGAGINRENVLSIAVNKGLVPEEANLTDSEIDSLLFMPGFSTASVVSDLSGRGVGMDVVKTSIQSLGGRITITSEPGNGTTFSISLPLTLAVLDGMVVQVAGETLVVPLNLVMETLTLSDLTLDQIRPGVSAVRVRGSFVPLFDLGVELGYRSPLTDATGCVVLLIAQEDGQKSALLIDDIRDQRQVVIKGLDDSFYRAPGIAAATILGDGQIALILDPTDIINQASIARQRTEQTPIPGVIA